MGGRPEDRAARLGTLLDCPLCDRAELPEALRPVRTSPVWDEQTMPNGLRRTHRLAPRTWGRLIVHRGRLRFAASTSPTIQIDLGTGESQAIPPEVEHEIEPLGVFNFSVEFFAVDRSGSSAEIQQAERHAVEEGGDPACWAGLLCPGCGAMAAGGHHRPNCPAAPKAST